MFVTAKGRIPPGTEVIPHKDGFPVVLKKRVILEGTHITGAQSGMDEYQRPQVNIKTRAARRSENECLFETCHW